MRIKFHAWEGFETTKITCGFTNRGELVLTDAPDEVLDSRTYKFTVTARKLGFFTLYCEHPEE